jgi:hypothetical protein
LYIGGKETNPNQREEVYTNPKNQSTHKEDYMEISCRECTLPVTPYNQYIQDEEDVCEFCVAAVMGVEDEEIEVDLANG